MKDIMPAVEIEKRCREIIDSNRSILRNYNHMLTPTIIESAVWQIRASYELLRLFQIPYNDNENENPFTHIAQRHSE